MKSEGAQPPARTLIGFGIAFLTSLCLTAFFYIKIPHDHSLMAVPEILMLLVLVLPILMWQAIAPPKVAGRICAIASATIWLIGIGASFAITPASNLICVPDAMLLIGFVPMLYYWHFGWTWLLFGAINFGIGVFLQAIAYIPDSFFPSNVLFAKYHLAHYHPPITWWSFGGLAFAFGLWRCGKNLWKRFLR